MMAKAALLVLVAILVVAILGRWGARPRPKVRRGSSLEPARKCPTCGSYVLGRRPEPCGRAECPMA